MPKNFWDILRSTYAPAQQLVQMRRQMQNQQALQPVAPVAPVSPPTTFTTQQLPPSTQPTYTQQQADYQRQEQERLERQEREQAAAQARTKKQYGDLITAEEKKRAIASLIYDPTDAMGNPVTDKDGKRVRLCKLIEVQYDGLVRIIEPYSYRLFPGYRMINGKRYPTGDMKEMLYAHCRMHGWIHSFDLRKIKNMRVVEEYYYPRWPIEIEPV